MVIGPDGRRHGGCSRPAVRFLHQGKGQWTLRFLGRVENKLDAKGRVSVPAAFRAALDKTGPFDGIYALRTANADAIDVLEHAFLQRLHASYAHLDYMSPEREAAMALFGEAQPLAFDANGRIQLTPDLIEYAGLSDRVLFVGRADTFQMWNPERYEVHAKEQRERIRSGGMRLGPLTPPPAAAPLIGPGAAR